MIISSAKSKLIKPVLPADGKSLRLFVAQSEWQEELLQGKEAAGSRFLLAFTDGWEEVIGLWRGLGSGPS